MLRMYSTVGTRGDCDLMLLTEAPAGADPRVPRGVLPDGPMYRAIPYSFLAMTSRPSTWTSAPEARPRPAKYLFVYPVREDA